VQLCARPTDRRISACQTAPIRSAILKTPKTTDKQPFRAAAATKVLDMLKNLGPFTSSGKHGEIITYVSDVNARNLCAPPTQIALPLDGKAAATLAIGVTTMGSGGVKPIADSDKLKLKCRASK
jgi:hypothetical protein